MGKRTILHVDMDSFFSSVEARERPELRGLPVVVGADPKEGRGRGVVSTCSYEAREHGIRSGMPISRAYKKCPDAIFLPVNMALYRKVSENIMEILRKYADKFQQISVDEAFLDISKKVKRYRDVRELVQEIKGEIWDREKLTCSVGVGPSKFIAKIASDFDKPDGLTVVSEGVDAFLAPLSVRRIPGVGEKTEKALKEMGIKTIDQLAECDEQKLIAQFGKLGHRLHLLAKGIDESEVIETRETKSLGREITFVEDTDDPDVLGNAIGGLANEVQRVLVDKGYRFRTLTLKIRFEDFET
ncbi:MAG: DNA polymerase IV, partial [Methanocellales archaeon]|nr:DNA polymerase IV [Methanocellales archaeon]